MKKWLAELDAKRLAVLLIGPGLVLLGVDAWIGHYAGKDDPGLPPQLIPVVFAPVAALVAIASALARLKPRAFQVGLTVVGALSALVGLGGTLFHLSSLVKDLSDEKLSWAALQGALGVAPPAFAPMAFVGVGALLIVLAQPRLLVRMMPKGGAPAVQVSERGGTESSAVTPADERAA